MKKLFAPIFAALLLVACSPDPSPKPPKQFSRVDLTDTPPTTHFIELCSGVEITDDNEGMIAIANCLGRVRGFSDGAMVSSQLYHTTSPWCVPEQVTDQDVLIAVLNWITHNPDRFTAFHKIFDPRTAATAAIIQGLRTTYPCRNT